MTVTGSRGVGASRSGRVRAARLTDLAALGELSRMSHAQDGDPDSDDQPVRSLGLPVNASQISVFSLFRMPLGAFQPHDPLYVYEEDGRLAGLARVERDSHRDEWTIVELDAIDDGAAGDIRFRLVQHLLRDGSKRGASRVHVACADERGNVDLFMQAGFARYGEEVIMFRAPGRSWPRMDNEAAAEARIRPSRGLDALQLNRLYQSCVPRPVFRLEGYRIPDWERQGNAWRIPRSSLTPILRFADIDGFVQEAPPPASEELSAFLQIGVAKQEQPHYLRVVTATGHDPTDLIRYGLSVIGRRAADARGVLTAVRTYESPLDHRLEEAGFQNIAQVSLLLKENLVRVAEPTLVPAVR
jgi:hypothetical protein